MRCMEVNSFLFVLRPWYFPIESCPLQIPKEHKFVVSGVAAQSLAVLAHTAGDKEAEAGPVPDRLAVEGKVHRNLATLSTAQDDTSRYAKPPVDMYEKVAFYYEAGLHLTAKIQDRGYGLDSLRLKPRFETEP